MSQKLTGYDFWKNVLHSPKYVAAPMVDMSEMSYRMLCRLHGAQLCYSPMLHSVLFSQDYLYRQDNFSTCLEDRPLIVQFCANNADALVNAAHLVSSQCDAVDLNLGCPQAIARKGYYGSFLQDDWDLIRSMVQKASYDLPIPITCKMRILPGHFKKSIEYAKMLEHAGCSVLTVHGRTREQKGHATGLASWDVIREIKSSVNIPVIANGNVLDFDDVERCMQYTKADAVMSAEALLHNPALFSGKNPPVWEIVSEYLQLAEKYDTSIRCVRCHLFKILYLCIYQDSEIRRILTDGSSFQEFYCLVDILKTLPNRVQQDVYSEEVNENTNIDCFIDIFDVGDTENQVVSAETVSAALNVENYLKQSRNVNIITPDVNDNVCAVQNVNILDIEVTKDKHLDVEYLPPWLCHSRPRIAIHDKSRGCFSKYFEGNGESLECFTDDQYLSKKQLRRNRHHERVVAAMKDKRKVKKMRRKQKVAEMKQLQENSEVVLEKKNNLTKKQQKMLIRDRLLAARGKAPKVCIDLGFASTMETKDLSRLSSQLRRLYGSNRHSSTPLHLYFCNFSASDTFYNICKSKNDGFESYVVEMTGESPEDLFKVEDLIYLSPDSDNVLEGLDLSKVYVIGGILDSTVRKNLTLDRAKYSCIKTARLPISEHLEQFSTNPGNLILTVNQVFDIILKYYETRDWLESLGSNVPSRKGYRAPVAAKGDLVLNGGEELPRNTSPVDS